MDALGIRHRFVQVNQSRSQQCTLRGLHFQRPPYAQAKLVRCLSGSIFDVAVDIRPKSPTFGQSFGAELSDKNHLMLYIPEGFAHGFLALTEADVEYACSDMYAPEFEAGVIWNDADIGINWPIPPDGLPLISSKDSQAIPLKELKLQLTN